MWTDELANVLAGLGTVEAMVGHLKKVWRGYSIEGRYEVDDVCAAVYAVARMARSIKLVTLSPSIPKMWTLIIIQSCHSPKPLRKQAASSRSQTF